ncbi:MAG: ABC transporter ATP-binding protein [Clostridia bacterium]|nr:ABC transporter ATP-binding protein [Clostridia bacterium]
MSLLEVKNLHTCFKTRKGTVRAVNDVTFSLDAGKTLAIVGESGSGKSVSAMSVLKLLDENGYIESGEILFDENADGNAVDLAQLPKEKMYGIRGNKISVIFQEPMTALNPVLTIRRQMCEPFLIHRNMTKKQATEEARKMLEAVRIVGPERVLKGYAHQLSGGMRQRVMIAMALACKPKILIADEPTTALDVTIQAQILRLMRELQKENGTAILFITHDLGVVREMADDVAVTYCGQIVEHASNELLFGGKYSHPYTEGLLASIPARNKKGERLKQIHGNVPSPFRLPKGCKFSPRCPYRTQKCIDDEPALLPVGKGRYERLIRCHYPNKEERNSDAHRQLIIRR